MALEEVRCDLTGWVRVVSVPEVSQEYKAMHNHHRHWDGADLSKCQSRTNPVRSDGGTYTMSLTSSIPWCLSPSGSFHSSLFYP